METTIRSITAEDRNAWEKLWAGYLAYYETELSDDITEDLFRRLLSDEGHFCFVAVCDGHLVGFVHGLAHASTWSKGEYCYLEDLFVGKDCRDGGVGRKLIEAVFAEADNRGCARVYWHTETSNDRARKLYDKIASLTNFVQYRR